MEIRLQRFLAQAGIASRRKAETLITDGQVRVNGRVVTELGSRVDPAHDRVEVDGQLIRAESHVYLLLNKPRGYMCTLSDPEGRPTVLELVREVDTRVYPVGRLDFNTEGLLVLTNDGELANGLMHPRREVQKTYQVKLRGIVRPDELEPWERGVVLDDGQRTAPARARVLGQRPQRDGKDGTNTWVEVEIHEGKNRQVHRMAEAIGREVTKLQRVGYAGLTTEGLRLGEARNLDPREVAALRKVAGIARSVQPKAESPKRAAEGRNRARAAAPRAGAGARPKPGGRPPSRTPSKSIGRPPSRTPSKSIGRPPSRTPPKPTGRPPSRTAPKPTGRPPSRTAPKPTGRPPSRTPAKPGARPGPRR